MSDMNWNFCYETLNLIDLVSFLDSIHIYFIGTGFVFFVFSKSNYGII